ncbi:MULTISPECIES: YciI family protein [unclassified Hahella]|uniref:YciI family protein n=1 Tax=unclassified Hahella TaxID=2624107 RepID=UPI000FDDE9CE|nr:MULTISPECIES: YciI family protein [unclassified Hahella]AZZ90675.1 YciI family protein [Hahella sp. KA22]MBU6950171.1 YciI family protein [Hahella sp. HN01]MDG9671241.1 YciI family protein [Hahella sp. CR1]QAY54045.1 YciI family protein [Hahella sp. KA22]WLQ14360.1 YciI family protein [Hahella sp. HNIBRBA332]
MKYLCLVYYDENIINAMTKSEWDSLNGECIAFGDEVRQSGHFVGGNALQPVETATTVRVRNGRVTTTDGPFAETKEQLAGFYMMEARDLNEAIQLAGRIPPARLGSIEIRPIRELQAPESAG